MADTSRLETALRNAHAAGDVAAATKLAQALKAARGAPEPAGSFDERFGQGAGAQTGSVTPEAVHEAGTQPAYERSSWVDPAMHGATLGLSDEIMGGIGGLASMAGGKGFGYGYEKMRDAARASYDAYRERKPVAAMLAELGGSLATAAVPVGTVARGASFGQRIAGAMKGGALMGGIYGAGSADGDMVERAVGGGIGAASGAASGAAAGLAVPAVAAGARYIAKPITNVIRAYADPEGFAAAKVAQRLTSQDRTVAQAAARIDKAAQSGQTMTLADVGGRDAQNLLRTAVNVPGPARNRVATKVNIAQMTQGDRLKTAIRTMFADPDAYEATKDSIIAARSSAAKPYYDAAYRQPVPFTRDLEELLQTPAGKAALSSARTNTANRREPWAQWFASLDDGGNIIDRRRVPDTRALDEVKRSLDQMVEAAKAPADGSPFAKARATPQSIAIQSVRDDLVKFLDTHNPAYARARSMALDNIQADHALEFGRNALGADARVVGRQMAKFSDAQRELARLGAAEALRSKIDKARFTNNAVLRIFGSHDQIRGLKALFADEDSFRRFTSFINNESRRSQTRAAVMGNSTTAMQLLDAQEAGSAAESVQAIGHAAGGNLIGAAMSVLQRGLRRLGGLTPEVADHIGKMLMTSNPAKVRNILQAIRRIEASNASREQQSAAIRGVLARFAAGEVGGTVGPASAAMIEQ